MKKEAKLLQNKFVYYVKAVKIVSIHQMNTLRQHKAKKKTTYSGEVYKK